MTYPFLKDPPAARAAPPKPLDLSTLGDPPPLAARQLIIQSILAGPPSISLFAHYWWLAGHPVPQRKDLQTNEQYLKTHWRHLKRAASAYVMPTTESLTLIPPT